MRGTSAPLTIFLAIVAVATLIALVTSISSLAMPAGTDAGIVGDPQDLTPTASAESGSRAGSTDGIMWMGIVISAIVLLPLLANRAMWQKQS